MLYRRSMNSIYTICWSAVGCEWPITCVYYGLPVYTSSLEYFLPLPCDVKKPEAFYLCQKYHLKDTKYSPKSPCRFKLELGLKDKYQLSWKRLSFEVFMSCPLDVLLGLTFANIFFITNILVATQWPLKRGTNLQGAVWYGSLEADWSYKNIVRHTAHTIVSWPNPKQWLMIHTSGLMMIIR